MLPAQYEPGTLICFPMASIGFLSSAKNSMFCCIGFLPERLPFAIALQEHSTRTQHVQGRAASGQALTLMCVIRLRFLRK